MGIQKLNLKHWLLGAAAAAVSASQVIGCGPAQTRPVAPPPRPGQIPINTSVVPQGLQNFTELSALNPTQAAQLNALLGNYTGQLTVYDPSSGADVQQAYTINLKKATAPQAPGKNYVQVTFTSGNWTYTSMAELTPPSYDANSWVIVTQAQNTPSIYEGDPIFLELQLSLNSSNQFDPSMTSGNQGWDPSCGPVCLVDVVTGNPIEQFVSITKAP